METLASLGDGFAIALTWQNLMLALLGCFLGTVMGALPGLGPSNGVAILIPLAFTLGLGATPSLILLTSVYYGAMYGGRISSILLNIPGDEPAMMTCLDGHPMAKKGLAGEALSLSGIASFVGAFLATWGLIVLAPQLVKIALLFGPRRVRCRGPQAEHRQAVSADVDDQKLHAHDVAHLVSGLHRGGSAGRGRLFGVVHFLHDGKAAGGQGQHLRHR